MLSALSSFRDSLLFALVLIGQMAIYWLPPVFCFVAWHLWKSYRQSLFIAKTEYVLIEIKLPKVIDKSPLAMELVTPAFNQSYEGNWFDRILHGYARAWFSLELVSLGGEVHFYIWTQKFFKNLVEAQIYSQYPDVEIVEVPDYTSTVPHYGHTPSDLEISAMELGLTKEDAYPIKTYVDYGLDKDPKEEYKIDPMTPMLEFLGSLGPGEQAWFQILVISPAKRYKKPGSWFKKEDWQGPARRLIDELSHKEESAKQSAEGRPPIPLPPGEQDTIKALERSVDKQGFECGIRLIYLAPKDKFRRINIVGLSNSFKQFNSGSLNGFKVVKRTAFNYKFQDPFGWRVEHRRREMFDAYRRRAYFFPPYQEKTFILNAEELATIYHFPGQVARTPSLHHQESKRGEPPTDLPV